MRPPYSTGPTSTRWDCPEPGCGVIYSLMVRDVNAELVERLKNTHALTHPPHVNEAERRYFVAKEIGLLQSLIAWATSQRDLAALSGSILRALVPPDKRDGMAPPRPRPVEGVPPIDRWKVGPDCARCDDTGRRTLGGIDSRCECKRGRRQLQDHLAEKHGGELTYDPAPTEPPDRY